MAFHHVIATVGQTDKPRVLFNDLSLPELKQRFILPYEKGKSFFSGNDLVSPTDLRSLQIIKTQRPEQVEREAINKEDMARIHELNSTGQMIIISVGAGYQPEDLAEAGEDVTHTLVKGPPGFKSGKWGTPLKVAAWVGGIVAVVAAAGVVKWLGWS